MTESGALITECNLARTFDGGAYHDAWDAVKQYRDATAYATKHDVKSGATASALDLPRSRLRTWIDDGGAPDAVHAIETARSRGWLNTGYDDREFTGLNALVANVLSGGSIAEQYYQPSFALNHRGEDSHVLTAFNVLNLEYDLHHAEDTSRATEARPSEDASLLGRVLSVLGAPVGPKAHQRLELPWYLEDAPEDVKRLFAVCYLENRGQIDGALIRFREERNDSYLRALARLFEDLTGERVSITEKNVVLSEDASTAFGNIR